MSVWDHADSLPAEALNVRVIAGAVGSTFGMALSQESA
jgi:hypothetical protein